MRSLAATLIVLIVTAACTTGPSIAPASPTVTSASSTVVPSEPPGCKDAAPAISGTAQPPITDAARIPGRALFWDSGKLRLLEHGRVREVAAPFFVRDWSSRVGPDGRVVALLGGTGPGEAHLWERTPAGGERLVKVPIELANDDVVAWSPAALRAHFGRWAGEEVWVVGLDGASHRAAFPSDAIYATTWRTDEELTIVTAPRSPVPGLSWPIASATLWSWRPPADPVRLAGSITLAGLPRWSPDGRVLASI